MHSNCFWLAVSKHYHLMGSYLDKLVAAKKLTNHRGRYVEREKGYNQYGHPPDGKKNWKKGKMPS